MNLKIGVVLDQQGYTIPFDEEGLIKVFEKDNNRWIVSKEIPISINKEKGMKGIREEIANIADAIQMCKIIVAKKAIGLFYTVLEVKGFNIYELEGKPEEFLDFVLENEATDSYYDIDTANEIKEVKKENEAIVIHMPQKINENGDYYLNLKEEQCGNGGFTSKQVLLPFFKKAMFYQLEIICSHIPPWFDREFESLGLEKEVEQINDNEYKVMVTRKICD
ncbi:Fe-only nitrogenase accessory protein AnfO [Natranaerovirga pectinivora]|uniref:Fe-only nitrogenase accessory protein AnfO n=1 Tax=Natranaerovirga pectinivora TaxID=682400 RepID=A0A4R3MQG4_9FIRM|nr:Fe-only nitrogenase accessory protein AnfO [Natranaerovirga pectinivora]TCT16763.1 Fe-only nitrogenase accessory protein AnfO [Natranaerovirga pectinivora]